MNILGSILLFVALGFFIYVYKTEKERDRLKYILPLIAMFGGMGFVLILRENITEFPIPGVGTVKTVAQQTVEDARFVKETRETVLASWYSRLMKYSQRFHV
jgi:Serpentine type 7TM GPCR chemoreceptor Srz